MKKVAKFAGKILLIVTIIYLLIWGSAIVNCEYLTWKYGYQFEKIYTQNTMLGELCYYKVMEYNDSKALVYFVTENKLNGNKGGDILKFIHKNGTWSFEGWWHTVWSNQGSADGYIWPYGR